MNDNSLSNRQLVVLVYPRISYEENYKCTWLPFSILYIADALRSQNLVDVIVYDENRQQMQTFDSLIEENAFRLLAVGFSIMTGGGQIQYALSMAECVKMKAPTAIRIFGGPHANVLPEQTCRHQLVSIVAVGPGQFIVPELVKALLDETTFKDIPGVWYKDSNDEVHASKQFRSKWTVDSLRNWEIIDATDYIQQDDLLGKRTLNYISTFGCCYSCRFCYEQQYKRKYHAIPSDKVISDVKFLVDKYNLTGIKFYDADFFIDLNRSKHIYTTMANFEQKISWAASIHPCDILKLIKNDKNAVHRLADCGCKRLLMGVESGDNRVLRDLVNKRATKEDIMCAAEAIDEAGIRGAYTFIIGFPGETSNEKQHTKDFAMQLAKLRTSPEIRFHGYAPYPGTPMYDDAVKDGFREPKNLEEWSTFDYYNMNTPWLTEEDEKFIQEWSKADNRRIIDRTHHKISGE